MFYFGHIAIGATIVSMCCGGFCILIIAQICLGFKIASGGEDTDPRMVCCLCIPFCSLLASLIWCFSNWIMVITEDIIPANGCPLDCNL
jgi:hypothetical protein